ncbi:MAG: caspase family protein [Gammaproteobacteria bacterium]|nr:caspase family protein [Gammaproteobacteria bacterium]
MKIHHLILVSMLVVSPVFALEQTAVNRYALIIGANNGGKDRVSLRYAQSDARLVAKVFDDLGGIDATRSEVLFEPTAENLIQRLTAMGENIRSHSRSDARNEFIFYYSGHSNESGILLGEELLEYKRLHKAIGEISSDVKVAILDSCASGAFTRIKGGKRRPTFLIDESSKVSGHAYLASSSADESAQESDAIGGSYFTHYFVSGLRGAGDLSNDKRVTLNEAYQFAFHETLARTESSLFGAQHAAYDIQLAGAGDLVLTDLHQASSTLVIPKEVSGRVYIRNSKEQLIVELKKNTEREIVLGMEPGDYTILVDNGEKLLKVGFTLVNNKSFVYDEQYATAVDRKVALARGDKPPIDRSEYAEVEVKISLFPDMEYENPPSMGKKEIVKFDVNLLAGQTDRLEGVGLGSLITFYREDAKWFNASSMVNFVGGDFEGGQGTGIANIVNGNLKGGQGAGVFNFVGGNLEGAMGSGVFNIISGDLIDGGVGAAGFNVIRGDMKGGMGAAGFNIVGGRLNNSGMGAAGFNIALGGGKGGMGAAGFNIVKGDFDGGQGAAGFNIAYGNMRGTQGSAGFNISAGDMNGVQGTAGFNVAKNLKGVQVSAGFNVAKELKGVQVSSINVAGKATGVHVGLFNFAREFSGVPVGLLSIYGNGRHDIGISLDELSDMMLSYKTGTKRIYNLLGLSTDSTQSHWRSKWAIGFTYNVSPRSYIDSDIMFASDIRYYGSQSGDTETQVLDIASQLGIDPLCVFCSQSNNTVSIRSAAHLRLARFLSVHAGASLNFLVDPRSDGKELKASIQPVNFSIGRSSFSFWPAVYAGVEF